MRRGLRRFIERDDASGLQPVVEGVRNILIVLQEMEGAWELRDGLGWDVDWRADDPKEDGLSQSCATGARYSGSIGAKGRYLPSITNTISRLNVTLRNLALAGKRPYSCPALDCSSSVANRRWRAI